MMKTWSIVSITALAAAVSGCSARDADANSESSSSQTSEAQQQIPASATFSVQTASRPSDACGWIPVAEVEAIIGTLAEPPRQVAGDCRYTLPIPAEVTAKRENYKRMMASLQAEPKAMMDFGPYAISIGVDVRGDITGERGVAIAARTMGSWIDDGSGKPDTRAASETERASGWDSPDSHGGRIGHVRITVTPEARDMALPKERMRALAARVRDRIPDLPFPMPADYSGSSSPDPCVLLTRQEAESVLGPLIVAPYRTANKGPLAYPGGASCAYFTRQHHVLILTPHWSGGQSELKTMRGIGGIVGRVANDPEAQSADTIEGPWDDLAMDLDGSLAMLKGDRLLEVQYLMASTDEAGALKLARIALDRLLHSNPEGR